MEHHLKILEKLFVYYYSSLPIEPYAYDIYDKIIDNIRKNNFHFDETDKKHILKLINILQFECDEYEIKILEKLQELIKD